MWWNTGLLSCQWPSIGGNLDEQKFSCDLGYQPKPWSHASEFGEKEQESEETSAFFFFFFACTHPKYVIIFVCSKHWVICSMLLQSYDRELFVIVHMGFTEKFSVTQVFHLLLLLGSQKSQWGGGGQGCHKGSLNVASGLPASCNTVCYCYLHWSH